jgi:hypothetical protein
MQSIIKEIKLTNIIVNHYDYPINANPFYNTHNGMDSYNLERSKFIFKEMDLNGVLMASIHAYRYCKNKTYEIIGKYPEYYAFTKEICHMHFP